MKSLTREELAKLLDAAKQVSHMDYLMLLVTFNHGLRVSETLALNPENLQGGYLVVQRLKKSRKTTQKVLGDELELLSMSGTFFLPEYANRNSARVIFWRKMQAYGKAAGVPAFKCHPHILRHSTGRLGFTGGMSIPDVQAYLGHVNGGNTLIYMQSTEEEAAAAFSAAVGK
jgi:integrase